jgi:molybdopterin biosynthesis enzyme
MSARTWQARIERADGEVITMTVAGDEIEAVRADVERAYPGASIVLAMLPRHAAGEPEA